MKFGKQLTPLAFLSRLIHIMGAMVQKSPYSVGPRDAQLVSVWQNETAEQLAWALRVMHGVPGQPYNTPVAMTPAEGLMLSAISAQGLQRLMVHEGKLNGKVFMELLRLLEHGSLCLSDKGQRTHQIAMCALWWSDTLHSL